MKTAIVVHWVVNSSLMVERKGHLILRADKRNLQIGKGGMVKWIGESRTVWQK